MSEVALSGILLWRSALPSEVAPTVGGAGRRSTSGGEGRALGAAHWC
jgi:hypothetical protein